MIELQRLRPRLLPAICGLGAVALMLKVGALVAALGSAAIPEAQAAEAKKDKDAPLQAVLPPAPPRAAPAVPPVEGESELLKALAERRAELDRRDAELREREAVLQATEKRIEEKLAKIDESEKKKAAAEKAKSDEEEARLKSLVKIYETMKPKEAARVFEQLEMTVLLAVVERMKEGKAAPILAAMEPAKAKAVTVALADKTPAPK